MLSNNAMELARNVDCVACVKALRLQGGARRGMDGKAGLRRRRARKNNRTIDADDGALEDLQTRSVRKCHP